MWKCFTIKTSTGVTSLTHQCCNHVVDVLSEVTFPAGRRHGPCIRAPINTLAIQYNYEYCDLDGLQLFQSQNCFRDHHLFRHIMVNQVHEKSGPWSDNRFRCIRDTSYRVAIESISDQRVDRQRTHTMIGSF